MNKGNAIIIGAGPAGFGAALALVRNGFSVTIFEKENEIGRNRRGETIRFNQKMEDLLYPGFFESQTIHKVNLRKYYSHTGKKTVDRKISTYNLIIHYSNFMKTIAKFVQKQGVKIVTGCEVKSLTRENGRINGVVYKSKGKTKKIKADLVVAASGHTASYFSESAKDRTDLDIPIYKKLVKNYAGPEDKLEYFFHVDDTYPAIGAIFPRGKGEAEVLITVITDSSKIKVKPLDYSKITRIIDNFAELHPDFGKRMAGTKKYYETRTMIPMGDVGSNILPCNGMIMAGDAVGQVEARGGSGIRSSFMMGNISGEAAAKFLLPENFSHHAKEKFMNEVLKSEQMQDLKKLNLKFGKSRRILFSRITTPEAMDRFWFFLKFFMK